jgi:hypothetical protein
MNLFQAVARLYARSLWFWMRAMGALVLAGIGGGLLAAALESTFGISADMAPLLLGACFFGAMVAVVKTYERFYLWRFIKRSIR